MCSRKSRSEESKEEKSRRRRRSHNIDIILHKETCCSTLRISLITLITVTLTRIVVTLNYNHYYDGD